MKLSLLKKKKTQIKGLECLNCGQPLNGVENFCSYCGQKNSTGKLSFGVFIQTLFSGFFSYDSRFWKTFIPLLTKPGKVSKEYIEGKRARFVNPFQLYLNVSIIFFLIIGFSINSENKNFINNNNNFINNDSLNRAIQQEIERDSTINKEDKSLISNISNIATISKKRIRENNYQFQINSKNEKEIGFREKMNDFWAFNIKNPNLNSESALEKLGYSKTFWNNFYYNQIVNVAKKNNQIKLDGGKSLLNEFISSTSISLFIFLPLFTLFIKLLYWRRHFTYMEHLVFVFNTQTVFFLFYIIFYLLNTIFKTDIFYKIFILLFLFYLYKAIRNFYEQGRFKTIIKFLFFNTFYLTISFIGIITAAVISFIFK